MMKHIDAFFSLEPFSHSWNDLFLLTTGLSLLVMYLEFLYQYCLVYCLLWYFLLDFSNNVMPSIS